VDANKAQHLLRTTHSVAGLVFNAIAVDTPLVDTPLIDRRNLDARHQQQS